MQSTSLRNKLTFFLLFSIILFILIKKVFPQRISRIVLSSRASKYFISIVIIHLFWILIYISFPWALFIRITCIIELRLFSLKQFVSSSEVNLLQKIFLFNFIIDQNCFNIFSPPERALINRQSINSISSENLLKFLVDLPERSAEFYC